MTDVRGVVESAAHSRRSSIGSSVMLGDDSGTIVMGLHQLIGSGVGEGDESIPDEVREALREVQEGASRDGTSGVLSAGYEVEIEVEETTTTTTTTVRTRESSRDLLLSQLPPRGDRITPHSELGAVSEDEWIELPSNYSSRRNSNGDIQMGDESSELPTSMNGRTSLAMITRGDTLNNPEQGKQRLQVVLKTITNKFTQRKRTIRRIDLALSSIRSASPPPRTGSPSRGQKVEKSDLRSAATNEKNGKKAVETRLPSMIANERPVIPQRKSSIVRALTKAKESLRRPLDNNNNNFSRSLIFPFKPPSPQASPSKGRIQSNGGSLRTSQASSAASTPTQSGASSPTKGPSTPQLRRTTSMRSMRSVMTTCTTNTAVPPEEPEPKASNYPHCHLVSNLQRFMRYSSGAYGQAFLRILGIGKSDFNFPHTSTHANNHAFAHHVGINVDDILLSSYTDPSSSFSTAKMSPIINYVAVDHSISAIVLSCRGSLGLSDILVDLLCDYETIPTPDGAQPGGNYQAHEGMWNAATLMQRGTVHDTLRDALESFPNYGLVLCGHSLGGGVAALLSILWSQTSTSFEDQIHHRRTATGKRLKYPKVATPFVTSFSSGLPAGRPMACYSYGVPCVVSPDLSDYCKGLVISTVNNLDIVSTLSLGVLRDLKTMAMGLYSEQGTAEEIVGRVVGLYQRKFMANRKKPDRPSTPAPDNPGTTSEDSHRDALDDVDFSAAERQSGRGNNRASDPNYIDPSLLGGQELNADTDGPLNDWLWSLVKTMRAGNDNDKLYPPGVVRVIESYTVFISGDSSKTGGRAKYSRKEGRRIVLRAVDNVEQRFGEPVFGRTMISDHSPLAYETSLDHLYSAVCADLD